MYTVIIVVIVCQLKINEIGSEVSKIRQIRSKTYTRSYFLKVRFRKYCCEEHLENKKNNKTNSSFNN